MLYFFFFYCTTKKTLEKSDGTLRNGQTRGTSNTGPTRHVGQRQTRGTSNTNKTCVLKEAGTGYLSRTPVFIPDVLVESVLLICLVFSVVLWFLYPFSLKTCIILLDMIWFLVYVRVCSFLYMYVCAAFSFVSEYMYKRTILKLQ
jgi:hypothetical protein